MDNIKALIFGASGTVYEKGIFQVNIKFPEKYPFDPPVVKFDTKIWHPNVDSQTGEGCFDLEYDWSPGVSLRVLLLTVQCLMSSPDHRNFIRKPLWRRRD